MANIIIKDPGFYSTIQDHGRFGYRQYGVPVSGCMDTQSSKLANYLLQNEAEAPVMEITLKGPSLHFEETTQLAISGGSIEAFLEDQPIQANKPFTIQKGETLHLRRVTSGVRSYLAIKDGFQLKKWLGSASFYSPITPKSALEAGQKIRYKKHIASNSNTYSFLKTDDELISGNTLSVSKGPEWSIFEQELAPKVKEGYFTVGINNRMAYQLDSLVLPHHHSILSSPVLPGTVQLTPSGKLVILMRDAQVTGGYPRVLQLTEHAINQLAQKKTGDIIRFKLNDLEQH